MIWLGRVLRVAAIGIAVAAAFDPAIALMRSDRPLVALIDAGGNASSLSSVSTRLAGAFDVHAGPIANAVATVIAGDALPDPPPATSGALFAVLPSAAGPRIDVARIEAPAVAPSGSKIPVRVSVHAAALRGRSITIDLFAGSLAVDSAKREIAADDDRADVELALPPSAAGLMTARILVRASGGQLPAIERHLAIDIRDQRWRVLVTDPRPSWSSTFVRRALEDDRRFDVASRVGTSKSVSAGSGTAPALNDVAALEGFDAIVIGAPDALTPADVRSLDRFARERGGSIVLLLDRPDPGPAAALLAAAPLIDVHGVERQKMLSPSGSVVATELALPRAGSGLTPLAHAPVAGKDTPVIWRSPLGAGRVVVNGALDAWRYRTRENGGFAKFWTDTIAAAAAASPAALVLSTASLRVAPGALFDVVATVRDVQLSDPSKPSPAAELSGPADFWPDSERGVFRATVKAPDTPGNYELRVQGSRGPGFQSSEVLRYVVAAPDHRSEPLQLSAWTSAHGGTVIADDSGELAPRIQAAIGARKERVESHPMRSAWWLPAFVILLGGEWWIRRRRGDR
jgi:hypothetical protein